MDISQADKALIVDCLARGFIGHSRLNWMRREMRKPALDRIFQVRASVRGMGRSDSISLSRIRRLIWIRGCPSLWETPRRD